MAEKKSHSKSMSVKKALPWIVITVLLLGIAATAGIYRSSNTKISSVQFSNNHFVSTKELQKVKVPIGVNADSVDFINIIKRYEKIPYVKKASISVEPGGDLMVNITERKPIALLVDGKRKIYVDKDGLRLSMLPGRTANVPILYGFSATPRNDTLNSDAFKTAAKFLIAVRHNETGNATISEVAWTANEGIVALTNQNGVKLIFGSANFEERLNNWKAFYGKVIKHKGIEKMRTIDLRFQGQIVTREK